jgi:RNA-directed DNA polymerase
MITGLALTAVPMFPEAVLHADHEPQSPQEWEQWLTATRKAIRKHAVTVWGGGTPDERVADRLVHAHCQRRVTGNGNGRSTSDRL